MVASAGSESSSKSADASASDLVAVSVAGALVLAVLVALIRNAPCKSCTRNREKTTGTTSALDTIGSQKAEEAVPPEAQDEERP